MTWNKDNLEIALQNSKNKKEVLVNMGKPCKNYETLNKYLKLYNLDYSHLRSTTTEETNSRERKYRRGDKHPEKSLYFWQYRFDREGTKSFEYWKTKEEFDRDVNQHKLRSSIGIRKDVLKTITRSALTRQKLSGREEEDLIDEVFVKELWNTQKGNCFWFNVPMVLSIGENSLYKVSIDRIDSDKGYIKSNTVLCCIAANRAKNNVNNEEWKRFLTIIR